MRVEQPLYDFIETKRKELNFRTISEVVRFLLKLNEYYEKTLMIELPSELKTEMGRDLAGFYERRGYGKT